MKNRFFLPTSAYFSDDIKVSLDLLKPLEKIGAKTGPMLVIEDGIKGLQGEEKKIQIDNLKNTLPNKHTPIIVMVSNKIDDLDFYHKPDFSCEHIKGAINFSLELPTNIPPVVTFHLNTLINEKEWTNSGKNPEEKHLYWKKEFDKIVWPSLNEISKYAKEKNVILQVETTPVPEFGDREEKHLNSLANPYPIFSGRGMKELRKSGLGIVLDLCHTFTLFKASSIVRKNKDHYNTYRGLFPVDINHLNKKNLMQEINLLRENDTIHLNDSKNLFDRQKTLFHEEGVSLGEGEIKELPEIVKKIKNLKLNIIFEINETDFKKRPNTVASINYFLKHHK